MKKILTTALSVCLWFGTASAQQSLTLEDAVLKQFSEFTPQGLTHLQWMPDGEHYSFTQAGSISAISAKSGQMRTLITLQELNAAIGSDAFKSFPAHRWKDANTLVIVRKQQTFEVDVKAKTSTTAFTLPDGAEHAKANPQHTAMVFVLADNITVLTREKKQATVTTDGGQGIVYGQSVHRNEFGIHEGLFWSPDGTKLAFYRMDETMVDDYPLVDVSKIPATLEKIKYPMAGRTSHEVTLGIYDLKTKATQYMKIEGADDQYLTSVGWTPDSKGIVIALLNRDQNHLRVNRYNAQTGVLEKVLFEEKHEKYVEPEHAPWFLPDGSGQFLWMSERTGFQHLYLYNTDGSLVRPITGGLWEAHDILGLDETGKYLYVTGTGETNTMGRWPSEDRNGTQCYTYQVDITHGTYTLVDSTTGTHTATLSPSGEFLIEDFTSTTVPRKQWLIETNGKKTATISEAADPLAAYGIAAPEMISLKASDGQTTLYGRIIKPRDFDPKKKYPVLVYVYGGPHVQLVTDSYLGGASLWMYWYANQGRIVAAVDTRGSANRGLEFEQKTFRNLGSYEVDDQKTFASYLQSLPYVDGDRMAIHGWSYGGFMTINTQLTHPGLFKAGVAGGPVCGWDMYEVMYTERYMDTPETNPEGYANSNLIARAHTLKDKLLVIHGTVDDVVVWQHSQRFVKACVDSKTQLDYFIYPGHPHNVRGKDRVHLMQKVLDYVDAHIAP